jgi:hypothetical protein
MLAMETWKVIYLEILAMEVTGTLEILAMKTDVIYGNVGNGK